MVFFCYSCDTIFMKNEIIFVTWSRFERFLKTKLAVKMIKLSSQCLLSFVLQTRLKGTKLLLYLLLSRFMTNSAGFASQPSRGDFHVRSKFFVLKSRACSSKEGDPPCPPLFQSPAFCSHSRARCFLTKGAPTFRQLMSVCDLIKCQVHQNIFVPIAF